MSSVLVTGGCGYIGSHMVELLQSKGERVIVLDNFSTGNKWAVCSSKVVCADLLYIESVRNVFREFEIQRVYHFAAKSLVQESQNDPLAYYENNIAGTINLLKVMMEFSVKHIVFSSTAAVYGETSDNVISEKTLTKPTSVYGETKLIVEQLLHHLARQGAISSISFRYFNAAGASSASEIGEYHLPETHLIPKILNEMATSANPSIPVYGTNYATNDGTCIRDYVHVEDICRAHLLGMDLTESVSGACVFNLGSGCGYSVKEIVAACASIAEKEIRIISQSKRSGDPARLVADISFAEEKLGWVPESSDLKNIVNSAWRWRNSDKFSEIT